MKIIEENIPPSLEEHREKLIECLNAFDRAHRLREVILFGSHARGKASSTSDVDLCLVSDDAIDQYKTATDYRRAIGRIRGKPALSLVPISPARLEEKKKLRDPFFHSVLAEGQVIVKED
jgi:predicted nucleotidyltransferase